MPGAPEEDEGSTCANIVVTPVEVLLLGVGCQLLLVRRRRLAAVACLGRHSCWCGACGRVVVDGPAVAPAVVEVTVALLSRGYRRSLCRTCCRPRRQR